MDLVITDPISSDYKQFHELIIQSHIQEQFINFRNRNITDTKSEIDFWVANQNNLLPHFLRLLKVTEDPQASIWDERNSTIIGFISNVSSGGIEKIFSGFDTLINFGISKNFENKGVMTLALKMTLERLYDLELNICTAFILHENYASAAVLKKCGFDKVQESPIGSSYAKALKIELELYKSSFNL